MSSESEKIRKNLAELSSKMNLLHGEKNEIRKTLFDLSSKVNLLCDHMLEKKYK